MCSLSFVHFYGEQRSYYCGYCSSTAGRNDYGLWLYQVRAEDYQNLIDRGWRRCGSYCYKPTLVNDCCPLYTIRCPANEFRLTKSQKKVIKHVNSYLISGNQARDRSSSIHNDIHDLNVHFNTVSNDNSTKIIPSALLHPNENELNICNMDKSEKPDRCRTPEKKYVTSDNSNLNVCNGKLSYSGLLRADEKLRSKAKLKRLERRRKKLLDKGFLEDEIFEFFDKRKKVPKVKSLEEFLSDHEKKKCVHDLKVDLILVTDNPDYEQYFLEEYELYKKYQISVHKEDEQKSTTFSYRRFLVTSTIEPEEINEMNGKNAPVYRYGLYHQHYRIDGKLIAVGVIDILPHCVSSVYFFYDPKYSFLRLGTYSSLREVALVRELSTFSPDLCYYYMGFYIHTCPKVRYKANIKPSYLLCPETYVWIPIESCQRKLDTVKYARFNDDPDAIDQNSCYDTSNTLVLYKKKVMKFASYFKMATVENTIDINKLSEIRLYSKLVGKKCAEKVTVLISS